MKKFLNTTSKMEYITPMFEIEELEKQDILLVSVSVGENIEADFDEFQFGDSGGPVDAFNQLFGN